MWVIAFDTYWEAAVTLEELKLLGCLGAKERRVICNYKKSHVESSTWLFILITLISVKIDQSYRLARRRVVRR